MTINTPSLPLVAIAGGSAVILAGANFVIMKSGGWFTTSAPVSLTLAIAIILGAYLAGRAWESAKYPAAVVMLGMFCAEGYNLFVTAETSMIHRSTQVAPVLKQIRDREKLEADLKDLEATPASSTRLTIAREALELAQTGADSPGVAVARQALADVQNAPPSASVEAAARALREAQNISITEAKDGGCKTACKKREEQEARLQAAYTDAAQAEARTRAEAIARAQAAVTDAMSKAMAQQSERIAAAEAEQRAALLEATAARDTKIAELSAAIKEIGEPDVSPTLFADKTGLPDWFVDLCAAIVRSLGLNLLGGGLIGVGSHFARQVPSGQPNDRARAAIPAEQSHEAPEGSPRSEPSGEIIAFPAKSQPNGSPKGSPGGSPSGSGGPKGGQRVSPEAVKAEILRLVETERFASQEALRGRLNEIFGTDDDGKPAIKTERLSVWLGDLGAKVSRSTVGRCKMIGTAKASA